MKREMLTERTTSHPLCPPAAAVAGILISASVHGWEIVSIKYKSSSGPTDSPITPAIQAPQNRHVGDDEVCTVLYAGYAAECYMCKLAEEQGGIAFTKEIRDEIGMRALPSIMLAPHLPEAQVKVAIDEATVIVSRNFGIWKEIVGALSERKDLAMIQSILKTAK